MKSSQNLLRMCKYCSAGEYIKPSKRGAGLGLAPRSPHYTTETTHHRQDDIVYSLNTTNLFPIWPGSISEDKTWETVGSVTAIMQVISSNQPL